MVEFYEALKKVLKNFNDRKMITIFYEKKNTKYI